MSKVILFISYLRLISVSCYTYRFARLLNNNFYLYFLRIPRSVQFLRVLEKDLLEKHSLPGVKKNSSKFTDWPTLIIMMVITLIGADFLVVSTTATNRRVILENAADAPSYDVFLGGSCNPTTWRKDLAVPYLQEAGVTFYNPVSGLNFVDCSIQCDPKSGVRIITFVWKNKILSHMRKFSFNNSWIQISFEIKFILLNSKLFELL